MFAVSVYIDLKRPTKAALQRVDSAFRASGRVLKELQSARFARNFTGISVPENI